MSLKNKIEDLLDRTVGRRGRKFLEQIAHFLLIGVPWGCIGAGTVWLIDASTRTDADVSIYIAAGLFMSILRATWREVAPPDPAEVRIGRNGG